MPAMGPRQSRRAFNLIVAEVEKVGPMTHVKPSLKAAAIAANQWVDDNAASFNAALPQPFKRDATIAQKNALLWAVLRARYEVSEE